MDSRIGLDYIVENRDYIAKLGAALDTQNATVKKQVFELLSALCAYSPDGYARAIETLEFYKVSGGSEGTTPTWWGKDNYKFQKRQIFMNRVEIIWYYSYWGKPMHQDQSFWKKVWYIWCDFL